MRLSTVFLLSLCGAGCGDTPAGGADGGSRDGSAPDAGGAASCAPAPALPAAHDFEPARAEAGGDFLHDTWIPARTVPKMALNNLWLVWGTGPMSGETYWAEFRRRYGVFPAEGQELPLGFVEVDAEWATINCLLCHADRVAGRNVVGVGNSRLDFQGFWDDLNELAARAEELGYPSFPIPWEFHDRTGAAGANDGFGLGFEVSRPSAPSGSEVETRYGFQQAPAWWTRRFRERSYTDGAGQVANHRTMMSTLQGLGLSLAEIQGYDDEFRDLRDYLLSLEAPGWPFACPSEKSVDRGEEIYERRCARCHGSYEGGGEYPDTVHDVGTDSVRAERFGAEEADYVNASWFGEEHPMTPTEGYLAPPLEGVWATAPYFHNGSVPDLAGVLDSSERPRRWRRTGSERGDYDPERVGWRYEVVDAPGDPQTIAGRKIYDTDRAGLSHGGHLYGDDLTESQRSALVDFLKTL